MKLQNRTTKNKVTIFNILLLVGLATSISFFFLKNEIKSYDVVTAVVCLIALLCLNYFGPPYFRYDSNGETLIIQNKKALPFSLVKEHSVDFPKEKLVKFNIANGFLFKQTLELYIRSRRSNHAAHSKLKFNITYLSRRDIKNLNISLNKVLRENSKVTIFDPSKEEDNVV